MKEYLMSGIAAIAFVAALTSCSSHDFEPMTPAQIQEAKYEQVFIQRFGQPAANQDWGFNTIGVSTRTRALSDYTGYKGSLTPSFPSWSSFKEFPSDADASKFLADVPSDVNKLPEDGNTNGGTWYIDNTTTRVNMYSTAGVIYVKGTVDLSGSTCFEVTQNTEIYLPEGATLKLSEADANKLKAIIYIAGTARLETANRLKMDNTSKVYNHGTIKAGAFEVNNNSFLYNVGTLESDGLVYVANNNSAIVNDGTINAGSVEVAGSGHVQNNAEWTVSGNTIVNSNSATWVNNGHWTTNNYQYTAGSENVINNCFLEVKNDFDINTGDSSTAAFKIDAGGGVLAKNFNGGKLGSATSGPYRIIMGSKSVFKVTGTATLDAGNKGTYNGGPKYGYGFFGPDNGDYAVFQATHIVKGRENAQGMVSYGGNLYVVADDHFAQGNDGNPNNLYIYEMLGFSVDERIYAPGFKAGKPDIKINVTPCNPGFEGGSGDVRPVEPTPDVRIIAEDLTVDESGDFDFNDVVFDVIYNYTYENGEYKENNGTSVIILRAAGGTLPLYVDGHEVHQAFGVGVKTMVNTKAGVDGKTADPFVVNYNAAINIPITVTKKDANGEEYTVTLTAEAGRVPHKIAVQPTFQWCNERDDIEKIYPLFGKWVVDPSESWY